jgi:phage repressor protein C with HTH and peptisase S24 domain
MTIRRSALDHARLWAAIDRIAHDAGLTPSGLARRAGLDATAFNKSKRHTGDGRPRWPSTESIAKVLEATGTDLGELARLIADEIPGSPGRAPPPLLPLLAEATPGFRDDGGSLPTSVAEVFATVAGNGESLYLMEVVDDRMLPWYRPGDLLIVSPSIRIRPGDRVVVIAGGETDARIYDGRLDGGIGLTGPGSSGPTRPLHLGEIEFLARILWASQ